MEAAKYEHAKKTVDVAFSFLLNIANKNEALPHGRKLYDLYFMVKDCRIIFLSYGVPDVDLYIRKYYHDKEIECVQEFANTVSDLQKLLDMSSVDHFFSAINGLSDDNAKNQMVKDTWHLRALAWYISRIANQFQKDDEALQKFAQCFVDQPADGDRDLSADFKGAKACDPIRALNDALDYGLTYYKITESQPETDKNLQDFWDTKDQAEKALSGFEAVRSFSGRTENSYIGTRDVSALIAGQANENALKDLLIEDLFKPFFEKLREDLPTYVLGSLDYAKEGVQMCQKEHRRLRAQLTLQFIAMREKFGNAIPNFDEHGLTWDGIEEAIESAGGYAEDYARELKMPFYQYKNFSTVHDYDEVLGLLDDARQQVVKIQDRQLARDAGCDYPQCDIDS